MKANYRYAGPALSVEPKTVLAGSEGKEEVVTVTAQGTEYGDIDWTAQSNSDWITITGASGTNSGKFTINVAANPTQADRTGSVAIIPEDESIDPVEITVVQSKSSVLPAVTEVKVSPAEVSVQKGTTQQFTATVTATGGASEVVTWTVTGNSLTATTISNNGLLTVAAGETASTITVTATSDFDKTKFGTASVTVTSQQITSAETTDAPLARVYPNPTNGTVTIEFETVGVYHISLADMTGKVLHRQTITDRSVRIDISSYPSGAYLLTIDDGKLQSTKRIVKNEE